MFESNHVCFQTTMSSTTSSKTEAEEPSLVDDEEVESEADASPTLDEIEDIPTKPQDDERAESTGSLLTGKS